MFGLTPYTNKGVSRGNDFPDFYDMFDGFFDNNWSPFKGLQNNSFKVDLRETDKEYVVEADLPGFKKDEIKLDFDDGRLTISAMRANEADEEKGKYIHRERSYSSMQRGIYLKNVTGENITAKFENGILAINVPKAQIVEKNTQIEIQ